MSLEVNFLRVRTERDEAIDALAKASSLLRRLIPTMEDMVLNKCVEAWAWRRELQSFIIEAKGIINEPL